MNILITGGAGFIGTRLAGRLLTLGHSVTIFDNFSPQIHGPKSDLPGSLSKHVRLVRGDVRDLSTWNSILPGHEGVVHLAAETGTGQSMYEVALYEQVNLAGTANLYELLSKNKAFSVQRVVVASSRAIYGEGAYLCSEHGVVFPRSQNAAMKRLGLFNRFVQSAETSANRQPLQSLLHFSHRRSTGLRSRYRSK